MDIYIPIRHACAKMREKGDCTYCPVFHDLPTEHLNEQDFLYVDTSDESINFDLQIGQDSAWIMTQPALHHAKRLYDDDTLTDAEDYTKRGEMVAKSLHFGSPREYLAAWLNEDRKQSIILDDLHGVLSLQILKKLPHWIRHDLFLVLESEAMKQVFARRFNDHDNKSDVSLPAVLKQALKYNAENNAHPVLSDLMAQSFRTPPAYNGCAEKFTEESRERLTAFYMV